MHDRRQVLLGPSCRLRGPRRAKGVTCWTTVCLAFQPQVCRSHASAGVLGANMAAGMSDNIGTGSCRGRSIPKEEERRAIQTEPRQSGKLPSRLPSPPELP